MSYEMLLDGYKYLVTYIYSPIHFYRRLVAFLKNYRPPKRRKHPIQFHHITALFRSIWIQGIWGEERFYYWKTLLWTALRRPRLFPLCMRLAIYGYHFRKVFKEGGKIVNRFQANKRNSPSTSLPQEGDRESRIADEASHHAKATFQKIL